MTMHTAIATLVTFLVVGSVTTVEARLGVDRNERPTATCRALTRKGPCKKATGCVWSEQRSKCFTDRSGSANANEGRPSPPEQPQRGSQLEWRDDRVVSSDRNANANANERRPSPLPQRLDRGERPEGTEGTSAVTIEWVIGSRFPGASDIANLDAISEGLRCPREAECSALNGVCTDHAGCYTHGLTYKHISDSWSIDTDMCKASKRCGCCYPTRNKPKGPTKPDTTTSSCRDRREKDSCKSGAGCVWNDTRSMCYERTADRNGSDNANERRPVSPPEQPERGGQLEWRDDRVVTSDRNDGNNDDTNERPADTGNNAYRCRDLRGKKCRQSGRCEWNAQAKRCYASKKRDQEEASPPSRPTRPARPARPTTPPAPTAPAAPAANVHEPGTPCAGCTLEITEYASDSQETTNVFRVNTVTVASSTAAVPYYELYSPHTSLVDACAALLQSLPLPGKMVVVHGASEYELQNSNGRVVFLFNEPCTLENQ